MTKVKRASLLATGQKVAFKQDPYRVQFTGLPEKAPDDPVTTLVIECEGEPDQKELFVRNRERPTI
jgi:alpha-L-fucosidase